VLVIKTFFKISPKTVTVDISDPLSLDLGKPDSTPTLKEISIVQSTLRDDNPSDIVEPVLRQKRVQKVLN
jgi:hypothetical protein